MLLVERTMEQPEVWRSSDQVAAEAADYERDRRLVAARFAGEGDVLEMLGLAS